MLLGFNLKTSPFNNKSNFNLNFITDYEYSLLFEFIKSIIFFLNNYIKQ